MGRNKNRNKCKKTGNNAGASSPDKHEQQTASHAASASTTSSRTISSTSPTPHRISDVTTEPPTPDETGSINAAKIPVAGEKRDSVISSTWEGRRHSLAAMLEPVKPRKWGFRPRGWWSCRAYRWIKDFLFALGRACTGPRWPDILFTLFTAAIAMFAGYVVFELVLSMLKTASAQDTTADTGCSIVYVTIPGPIVTVSLINTSPTNPARGTYYFSIVNGTTGWLNSIAPPSQFSTLVTRTPDITPVISSVPATLSPGSLPGLLSGPTTNPQPTTPPSATLPLSPTSLVSTLSSPTPPTNTFAGPSSLSISSVIITITSIAPGGQTTILTSGIATTLSGVPPVPVISSVSAATSNMILTLISTISGGPITTLTGTSTTVIGVPSSVSPSNIPPITSSSLVTLTSTISGGLTTVLTSTSIIVVSPSSTGPSTPSAVFSSSNGVITLTSTLPGGPPTTLTSTSMTNGPSSNIIPSSLPSPTISSILTTLTSSLPGGQTTTMTRVLTTTIGTMSLASTPSSLSASSSSSAASSSSSSSPGSPTSSGGFTISLPNPSSRPSSVVATAVPSVITHTVTQVTSGVTTTLTLLSTTAVSVTVSSSPFPSSGASSSTTTLPPNDSGRSSPTASSSMFSWPSSSTSPTSVPSGMSTSRTSSSSASLTTSAISSTASSGVAVTTSVILTTPAASLSPTVSSPGGSLASTVPLASTIPSGVPSASSSSSLSRTSASTLSISSTMSTTTTTGGVPGTSFSSVFVTLVPPVNTTSSSSSRLTSSSSSSNNFTRSSTSSSSTLIIGSGSISTTSVSGSMTIQTSTPTDESVTSAVVRDLTTRIISYGDTSVSFVFPTPDITTTVSYWTGMYPTVTGPMPSDLATIVPTTRSTTQIPISGLPSFQVFSSRPRSFKTVVTTIYDDDGPEKRNEKREADPQVLQSLVTTTVQVGTPTSAEMSAIASPGPTSCGESGNFTLSFDDTTVNSSGDKVIEVNGLRNPYHHLFYANGYTDIPDKWEPFPAISQPNVAMFLPGLVGRLLTNQPFAGTLLPGELGAGPRASVDAYWFNAYSGYFGCALNGLEPCQLRISGYRYDTTLQTEVLVAQQNATLPACPLYIHCQLTQVIFNAQFQALSGIQFQAYTGLLGVPQIHFLDDLQLEWYNNTCSAGILRIGHL